MPVLSESPLATVNWYRGNVSASRPTRDRLDDASLRPLRQINEADH